MSDLEQPPVIIRPYPNARLYDGETGCYRSLDELRARKQRQLRKKSDPSSWPSEQRERRAGTHTPRPLAGVGWQKPCAATKPCGYGL